MAMITHALESSLLITGFVAAMLLLIEYANVYTSGRLRPWLRGGQWRQYVIATALGVLPGCLGAFTVVSLYAHGLLSLGALVAAMVATSGDEAFVMLAMIPRDALLLNALLIPIALVAAWATDRLRPIGPALDRRLCDQLAFHAEETCDCFPGSEILRQWRRPSVARVCLIIGMLGLITATSMGWIGPGEWNWIRVTLLVVGAFATFVVVTVPDHFLSDHLWGHVLKHHVPKVFLWTLGTLLVVALLSRSFDIARLLQDNRVVVLLLACVVGLVPESGPHLIFVTLFADGLIPFSVLLASSVVQDGHGMLPFLAHSRRGFITVKLINFTVGLAAGLVALAFESL